MTSRLLADLTYRGGRTAPARLRSGHRVALVWTAGVAYLGLVLLLTWQALRGQSVVAPDAITQAAVLALAGATAALALAIVGHGFRTAGR